MLIIAVCEDKSEDMKRLQRMLLNTGLSYHLSEYTDAKTLIDDIEESIKLNSFTRCHKGFIVNLSYVNKKSREVFI